MATIKKHKVDFYKWDDIETFLCKALGIPPIAFRNYHNITGSTEKQSLLKVWESLDQNYDCYESEFIHETNLTRCIEEIKNAVFFNDGIFQAMPHSVHLIPALEKLKDEVGPTINIQY